MVETFKSNIQISDFDNEGSVSARCPSNIALIKYWGKREPQIPMNPSLSFTLTESYTETELRFKPKASTDFAVKIFMDGELKNDFSPKILKFFDRIEAYLPFLRKFEFEIHTHNTFPHSSGIASSASGLGALAFCLTDLENILGGELSENEKLRKTSFLARLGSGSACRSIYPGITVWGETELVKDSSDLYAIPYPYEIHETFKGFRDSILLIDEGEKQVSSTVGHQLMENHPYAKTRFEDAKKNLQQLIPVLKSGDLETFGKIVEHEALSLHAMMMTSDPYFILMKPDTVKVIDLIWSFRKTAFVPLFFTLDAGANIHILYPNDYDFDSFAKELKDRISNKKKIIQDLTF